MTPFPDCPLCKGSGRVMAADEDRDCPECSLRARMHLRSDALLGYLPATPKEEA